MAARFLLFSGRSEKILDSLQWKSKSPEKSFFVRLKPRDDYFGLALHEGDGDAESDGEPILTIKEPIYLNLFGRNLRIKSNFGQIYVCDLSWHAKLIHVFC
jgi:hypothetical protein